MNNVQTRALWDTGAQVSIVSKDWIAENLPTAESRRMDELLNYDVTVFYHQRSYLPQEYYSMLGDHHAYL